MKTTIGIIGTAVNPGEDPLEDKVIQTARDVGRLIAERGGVVVTDGVGGVNEAVSEGAQKAGGLTIGFFPQMDRAQGNRFLDVALPTGLGSVRNLLSARGCDALVMIGGHCGGLNKLTIAYVAGRPVVILRGTGHWADRIEQVLYDGRYLDARRKVAFDFANTPAEAVQMAFARAENPGAKT